MKHTLSLFLALAAASAIHAQNVTTASISGSDIAKYIESPAGQLAADPGASLVDILQGTATAAGGNVELFFSSDSPTYDAYGPSSAFATVTPTVLHAGFSGGQVVDIRSLNGADWFTDSSNVYNTAYGANNSANAWFANLLVAMTTQGAPIVSAYIAGNESALFNSMLASGGFAQISDPNISYVHLNGSNITVGLGGFLDARIRLADLLGMNIATINTLFPNGFQVSEAAIINGQLAYGFSAVNSGVVLNDGVNSYSGTYQVSVPEPSGMALALVGSGLLLARRRR